MGKMSLYKYFLIFLRLFLHLQLVSLHNQINVGTVLFAKKDLEKKCWNDEQIALLRARLIYQDILPKATLIDVKNDEFLNALIKYFHLAINKVKNLADGPTQRINLTAMSDVLGGYFRNILIPLTKRAFYSGKINFDTTQNVLRFYDELKLFLHTDGKNWAPPGDSIMNTNRFARENPISIQKTNDSCDKLNFGNNNGFIYIPIPFFDSKKAPSAIAIPFKENPLRSMNQKSAINCIFDFYLTAKNCLEEKRASRQNKNSFYGDFDKFLDTEVFPHLTDEKVYPAFGSVFRIKNEINRKNVEKRTNSANATAEKSIKEVRNVNKNQKLDKIDENDEFGALPDDDDDKAPIIVLVCLCVVTALWLCITLYYCAKNRKSKLPKSSMTDDESPNNKSTSSVIKIPDEHKRSSISRNSTNATSSKNLDTALAPPRENTETNEKKIAFVDDLNQEKRQKCQVCARTSQQFDSCPKCKKKHCRCIKNIWSTLSKYTITYPRIFPKKNPHTLETREFEKKRELQNREFKQFDEFSDKSEHKTKAQAHFLVQMASVIPKPPARSIKSAPVTVGKNIWHSENTSNVEINHEKCPDEKIFVFGYDFETSSSDDSSFTDESSTDTI